MSKKNLRTRTIFFLKTYYSQFVKFRILKESAALTFVTVLGFVPFIFFLFFMLPDIPIIEIQHYVKEVFFSIFLPNSAEVITEYLSELFERKIPFNILNFLMLLVTSYSLFNVVNTSFDKILNVREITAPNKYYNMLKFFGMILFGFILIIIFLSAMSFTIVSRLFDFHFMQNIVINLVPVFLIFVLSLFMYFFLPTVQFKTTSLMIGSGTVSLFWMISKLVFDWYITYLTNMKVIYGVLSSVPIFLFWVYLNWILFLSGVVIVSILEKRYTRDSVRKRGLIPVRITIEKLIPGVTDKSASYEITPNHLKELLKEILQDTKKK